MPELTRDRKRHLAAYRFFKALVGPYMKRLFRMTPLSAPQLKGPYLVYANHNADLDPVLLGLSFKEHIYFVASEHVYRAGFASKLLKRYFDPISRLKGSSDASAVKEILRRLRAGFNVCIFAEGNRSFDGRTCPILPTSGKLAKICGVPLVTYKFEGGYFTTPRWAFTMRHGRMRGYVVNIYSPEQLAAMGVNEINEAIAADLYEDAYARQAEERIPFRGKRLAEGLEAALYICPQCGRINTLQSRGDAFFCGCGLNARYDEYGQLHGAPFGSVAQWDDFQRQRLPEIAAALGDEAAFGDESVRLVRILDGHRSEPIYSGPIAMYRDRIELGEITLPISELSDMALYGRANIALTCGGKHYDIVSDPPFCGRKYLELYQQLKTKG
ncbi:MAG: lysophospholipid acyltransferase family protein [Bacillota bacterium]